MQLKIFQHYGTLCAHLSLACSSELGPLRQHALLEAGGAVCAASLQGSGAGLGDGGRLYVGASRGDHVLPMMMQPCGPVHLATVGSLVAGLRVGVDVGSLCPRAGILSHMISFCTFSWSHPRPWSVLLPGGRETHQ